MEIKEITNVTLPSLQVLDFGISTLNFDEQALLILRWARLRKSKMVCLANVHMLMEAHCSQAFSAVLQRADLITSDGMPLVWVLKAMGVSTQQRVAGMDLFLTLCELASLSNVGIFFLGSHGKVLEKIRIKLEQEYPNLKISGMKPLPFRPLVESEDNALVEQINNSGAGIVLVCLGCPKQEYWMAEHIGKIQAVMIGVGAVFPVYAGIQKHAPKIIRENGMEWAYRLIQEPQRLWPRYRQTIPPFIYLATKQVMRHVRSQLLTSLPIQSNFILGNQIEQNVLANPMNLDMVPAKIGEILVRNHLVNEQHIALALSKQKSNKQKLGEILLAEKIITEPELNYYLCNQQTTLKSLLVQRKMISSKKMEKFSKEVDLNEDKLFNSFLLNKKIISENLLKILLAEKYLRIKGFWLNVNRLEEVSILTNTIEGNCFDIAPQF